MDVCPQRALTLVRGAPNKPRGAWRHLGQLSGWSAELAPSAPRLLSWSWYPVTGRGASRPQCGRIISLSSLEPMAR